MSNTTKPIDFLKYRYLYFVISLCVLVPGAVSLLNNGLLPSIDFTGGTLIELQTSGNTTITEADVLSAADFEISTIQETESGFIVRSKPIDKDANEAFKAEVASRSGLLLADSVITATNAAEATVSGILEEVRFETVGPTLGQELLRKTYISIALAAGAILLYVAYRFNELKYGICAIIAMFHDTLILIGVFSLLGVYVGVEVDSLFVTAVLTTLSFSVHDTIVVYDRIRELLAKHKKVSYEDILNKAVAETLSRSINNSMTIIFMLLALWLLGGDTIRWFVFALLIGTIAGTYSSTFTAVPLLKVWEDVKNRGDR